MDVTICPLGTFNAKYSILLHETTKVYGIQPGVGANTTKMGTSQMSPANAAAASPAEFGEVRLICSQHPNKKHCTRLEREGGPRFDVRRFSFSVRHKRGAIEEEGSGPFAMRCIDSAFPQLKLWLSLSEAAAQDHVPVQLQVVRAAWIEVDETVPAASADLFQATPPEKTLSPQAYHRRQARRMLGLEDDDQDMIQTLLEMEETHLHAYITFEPLPAEAITVRSAHALKLQQREGGTSRADGCAPPAPPHSFATSTSSHQSFPEFSTATESSHRGASRSGCGTYLWSTAELSLMLSHLSQFAKLTMQFTRRGTRRRSGSEPTIMLDIDEDHVYVILGGDEHGSSAPHHRGGNNRIVQQVILTIDSIATSCKLRDNRYVQSPSIVRIQHDFDASVWSRVRFPTAAPLTGAGAEAYAHAQDTKGASSSSNAHALPIDEEARHAMVGVKTTMFLLGLMLLRFGMREDYDVASVRVHPGAKKPPFLLDNDQHLRHDATFRAVLLQLLDSEEANRPGPSQVLEAIREGGGGTYRSRRGSVLSPTTLVPATPSSLASRGGPRTPQRSVKDATTIKGSPCPSPRKDHASVSNPLYDGTMEARKLADLMATAQRQSERGKVAGLREAGSPSLTPTRADDFVQETKFEWTQRIAIRRLLSATKDPFDSMPLQLPAIGEAKVQTPRADSRPAGGPKGEKPMRRHSPTKAQGRAGDGASSHAAVGAQRPVPAPPSPSTLRTAETATNDVRPTVVRSGGASAALVPISSVFEL